jgi:cytochrome c553
MSAALFPFTCQAQDVTAGEKKAAVCVACHGPGGNSTDPAVPSIAAQPPTYTFYQLIQFREERRKDARMSPFAQKLTDADMKDIAAYYAAQKLVAPAITADAAKVAAGKAVAERNFCGSCHMGNYAGQNHIARLAGQHVAYLVKELRGFKTGARPDIDGTMASAAQPLSDADIDNVAHYLATLR